MWAKAGDVLLVSGVQMRKHSCSASTVMMFPLGASCAVFGMPPQVHSRLTMTSKEDRRQRRAKFNLTRRSDCLVPAEQKCPDTSWILAIYRAAQNWSCSFYCCCCHGRPKQYTPAPASSSFLTTSHKLQRGQEKVKTAHGWECRSWKGLKGDLTGRSALRV